jgi:hypothetical protein
VEGDELLLGGGDDFPPQLIKKAEADRIIPINLIFVNTAFILHPVFVVWCCLMAYCFRRR